MFVLGNSNEKQESVGLAAVPTLAEFIRQQWQDVLTERFRVQLQKKPIDS